MKRVNGGGAVGEAGGPRCKGAGDSSLKESSIWIDGYSCRQTIAENVGP